jgi:hypothetical protein
MLPITSADLSHEARSHTHRTFPDGFVTFIRFTVRAREGTNGGIGIVYPRPTPMLRSRSGAWPVRTSDASSFSAGAGLHRGSFRRTDRVVAGKGRSKCRRSRATRHHECDRPGSPRNGTQPICAVRALDGRLHRFRDGAPGARSDRARKSVSSLMKSSPPSAIAGAFRHPNVRLRRATASMRGRPQPDRC